MYVDCNNLTVSLLNTQLWKRHAVGISRASKLVENDILCLIESQIIIDTDVAEVLEQLSSFKVYFNSCSTRHQNLKICLHENILLKRDTFPGKSVIVIAKSSFSHDIIRVMLVYCCPNFPLMAFYSRLENLLSCHCIDIVLGDFNIDALNREIFYKIIDCW